MSRVAFLGPSLDPGTARAVVGDAVELRPPARAGDVARVLADGAVAIGLVDGVFGAVPAVRHGEILLALAAGVPVLGASSMGALRAAELAAFGMVGVGAVFESYAEGRLVADADVALLHGPAETGWRPLSVPLVDALATIGAARAAGVLDEGEAARLEAAARRTFYAERRWPELAAILPAAAAARFLAWLPDGAVSVKAEDAMALLQVLSGPLAEPLPVAVPRTEALDGLVRSAVGESRAWDLWERVRRRASASASRS